MLPEKKSPKCQSTLTSRLAVLLAQAAFLQGGQQLLVGSERPDARANLLRRLGGGGRGARLVVAWLVLLRCRLAFLDVVSLLEIFGKSRIFRHKA